METKIKKMEKIEIDYSWDGLGGVGFKIIWYNLINEKTYSYTSPFVFSSIEDAYDGAIKELANK